MAESPLVSIVMGSDSDLEIMNEAAKALDDFGIAYEIDVTSAHRSPARTADYARNAPGRGIKVIIAGAGGAAHLAGVIAAETTIPGDRGAHSFHSAERHGLIAGHCADARGHSRGHDSDRQARRHERGDPGGADHRPEQLYGGRQAERDERKAGEECGREIKEAAAVEEEIG